jgi:hypothetical protein
MIFSGHFKSRLEANVGIGFACPRFEPTFGNFPRRPDSNPRRLTMAPTCWIVETPHCSILFLQTDRLHLAPFDDQGYPFSLDRGFGEPHEAWPRWRLPGCEKLGAQLSLVIK